MNNFNLMDSTKNKNEIKVVIFLPDVLRKRGGGPSTYLYNLRLGFEKICKPIKENYFKINNFLFIFIHCGIKEKQDEISPDLKNNILLKLNVFHKFLKNFFQNNPLLYFTFSINYRLKRLLKSNLKISL